MTASASRRAALSGASLIALAACAGGVSSPGVEQIANTIQAVLPFVDMLATGIAVAVPATAPALAAVAPYLAAASTVFATIDTSMSANAALPIVQQVEDYVADAVKAIQGVVAQAPADSPLAKFAAPLGQALAVIALLKQFVDGVTGKVTVGATVAAVPSHLYIRPVR